MICNDICFIGKHNVRTNEFVCHKHDFYEVIYFLRGTGEMVIGENRMTFSPNKYCIVPPNTEHMERLGDDGEILFIGFALNHRMPSVPAFLYEDDNSEALQQLESVFYEFKSQNMGYKEAACALLQLFLVKLLRQTTTESKGCKDLFYVKTYLEQYYGQKIIFRELSDLTGYSYDYFRHIFKQTYGVSPQDYLVNIRLMRAKEMLQNTGLSCSQISAYCGFSNCAQMSTMIKREFGLSPTQIRKAD